MEQTKNYKLEVFPIEEGALGKFQLNEESNSSENFSKDFMEMKNDLETIIILDISGSMGKEVERICSKIIPSVLNKLNYLDDDLIHFITFDSESKIKNNTIKKIFSQNYSYKGCTNFLSALDLLKKLLIEDQENKKKNVRILTISDGMFDDTDESVIVASQIFDLIKCKYNINSQAVRYFTNSEDPDTRGLSSILQWGSNCESQLVDCSKDLSDENIIDMFVSLFSDDKFTLTKKLFCDYELFKEGPFAKGLKLQRIKKGDNIFWLEKIPTISDVKFLSDLNTLHDVEIIISEINNLNYFDIMESRFNFFLQRLKILKIVNTKESLEELKKIIDYFQKLEKFFDANEANNFNQENQVGNNLIDPTKQSNINNLASRLETIKKSLAKKEKSYTAIFSQIANDDKVNKLNAAQQAAYLRNLKIEKNSKGLAKRAINKGIDFDEIALSEVRKMHENFSEISSIDDTSHTISFYSNCSTLEGIRTLCKLVDDDMIDDLGCMDILKLLNIVGIACDAPIGNYPDPMVYYIKELFAGCYASVSDLITVEHLSKGNKYLQEYATKRNIFNIIPFFDDERIHKFLKKYAPNLLEYTASLGMRRVLANIPQTYNYILVSGCLKMIEIVDTFQSDVNIRTLIFLVKTYEFSIGNYFDFIFPLIKPDNSINSIYIGFHGVSNLFSVILKKIKRKDFEFIDDIIRAVYQHEVYLVVRKFLKDKENPIDSAKEKIMKLLMIDFANYATKVPEVFEEQEKKPKIFSHYEINESQLENYIKSTKFVDYFVQIPEYLMAIYSDDPFDNIKKIPKLTDDIILNRLKINFSIKKATSLSEHSSNSANSDHSIIESIKQDLLNSPDFQISSFIENENSKEKESLVVVDSNKRVENKNPLLRRLKFYNIIQSLIHNQKSSRVDEEKMIMKITDLIYLFRLEKEVRKNVFAFYKDRYFIDLKNHRMNEKQILMNIILDELLRTDIEGFKHLIKNGISKGTFTLRIDSPKQYGYLDLVNRLSNPKQSCNYRFDKIQILVFGYHENENKERDICFNNGNPIGRDNFKIFEKTYKKFKKISEYKVTFKKIKTEIHLYRDLPNRQGHCNEKPSYWALGYDSILIMKDDISKEEWLKYRNNHCECCGIKYVIEK